MIVVDASALVAIDLGEPEAAAMDAALWRGSNLIAAPTVLEATLVFSRRYDTAADSELATILSRYSIAVEPFTALDLVHAQRAFLTYGKGRHPAALNFGDCVSYALAKRLGAPLLYVGEVFRLTDVQSALS